MSRIGVDYAWGHISPQAHKKAGSSFACRYLSHDPGKNLSPAEAHELRTGGIDIVTVWETTATRALGGRAAGQQDAAAAHGQAQACGIPEGRPIFFAVDFDESPPQAAAVAEYFRGVHDMLDNAGPVNFPHPVPVGVYGGFWTVKRLFDAHLVSYGWQTYAWSGRNVDPRAQLYQYSNGHVVAGVGVDFNRALKADFGQWGFQGAKPAPSKPSGTFRFVGTFDFGTGKWTLQGTPSKSAKVGGPHRRASAEIQVDGADGQWRVAPLEWNSPPLG